MTTVIRKVIWLVPVVLALCLIGGIPRRILEWKIGRAIAATSRISRARLEKIVYESKVLAKSAGTNSKEVPASATPFNDLRPERVFVSREGVALFFFKFWEDEVALDVSFDPDRVRLITPGRDGDVVREIWPTDSTK